MQAVQLDSKYQISFKIIYTRGNCKFVLITLSIICLIRNSYNFTNIIITMEYGHSNNIMMMSQILILYFFSLFCSYILLHKNLAKSNLFDFLNLIIEISLFIKYHYFQSIFNIFNQFILILNYLLINWLPFNVNFTSTSSIYYLFYKTIFFTFIYLSFIYKIFKYLFTYFSLLYNIVPIFLINT